jgi:hypothetical protein
MPTERKGPSLGRALPELPTFAPLVECNAHKTLNALSAFGFLELLLVDFFAAFFVGAVAEDRWVEDADAVAAEGGLIFVKAFVGELLLQFADSLWLYVWSEEGDCAPTTTGTS